MMSHAKKTSYFLLNPGCLISPIYPKQPRFFFIAQMSFAKVQIKCTSMMYETNGTVNGRNPAPPGMYNTLQIMGVNYLSIGA